MAESGIAWPRERLGEGLLRLARASRLGERVADLRSPEAASEISEWVEQSAGALGIEAVAGTLGIADIAGSLRARAPSLVRLRRKGADDLFLLATGRGRALAEDGTLLRVREADVLDLFVEGGAPGELESLLDASGIPPARREEARRSLLRLRLSGEVVVEQWQLSPRPGASLAELTRHSGLDGLVALFASTYALDYGLFVLSWWLLGRGALGGSVEGGALLAWALLFAAMLPFRMLATWSAGKIAVTAGSVLKKRLLAGAMLLEPDELRSDGAGRHLARVFESEAVESLALTGGLLSAAAAIELLVAAYVVSSGAGGLFAGGLLLFFVVGCLAVAGLYYRVRRRWTDERLGMSHELVERMVGHRTRLAQQPPERRQEGEREALGSYVERSKKMDRLLAIVHVLPRLWLAVAVLALAMERGGSLEAAAVGLGGAILASRALTKLADGLSDLLDATIAWKRVAPLFQAAAREPRTTVEGASPRGGDGAALEASGLSYRYPRSARVVLRDIDLKMKNGDRVLLESPSGGGKSTLISLLNGLRAPSSGVVRIGGLEGKAAVRSVATAPQFHENHVFTESFAFNLLMSRRWPPRPSDWKEAEAVCRELGLAELVDRMPGGMNQVVGDTGWQLSHGEKSRLFLARALLQGGNVVLLDESFAALDPENLRHALLTALARAETLFVVAHI